MNWLFPLAYVAVTQSATVLLLAAGVLSRTELAAEIGLVQGVLIALFHALSTNARGLILGRGDAAIAGEVLSFRLVALPLVTAAAVVVSLIATDAPPALIAALVARRAVEWVNEIDLTAAELRSDRRPALRMLLLQAALLAGVVAALPFGPAAIYAALAAWALAPLGSSLPMLTAHRAPNLAVLRRVLSSLLPHLGSTVTIGLSIFAFRLVVAAVNDKAVAGMLFSAIAFGSVVGTMYANVVGPSMLLALRTRRGLGSARFARAGLWVMAAAGLAIVLASVDDGVRLVLPWDPFFVRAVGFSLIGGVVMVAAQRARLWLLEHGKGATLFGADALSHLLLVLAAAATPMLGGQLLASALYLVNAALCLACYMPAARAERRHEGWAAWLIPVGLFLPLFFLLTGRVYQGIDPLLESDGTLVGVPLPIAVPVCFAGLFLLARYADGARAIGIVFGWFAAMLAATFLTTGGALAGEKAKLLLLLQCTLPAFGLALGAMYAALAGARRRLARALFWTIAGVTILQLAATWLRGAVSLTHDLMVAAVYQHFQYVPSIFACGFLVAVGPLAGDLRYRVPIVVAGALLGTYVAASYSLLAEAFTVVGLSVLAAHALAADRSPRVVAVALASAAALAGYTVFARDTENFLDKYGGIPQRTHLTCVTGEVAVASSLIVEADGNCRVVGEPKRAFVDLLALAAVAAAPGDRLVVEGTLREGRIAIGFRSGQGWDRKVSINRPGPFRFELEPPANGSRATIANDHSPRTRVDFTVSRFGYADAAGNSRLPPHPARAAQAQTTAVDSGLPANWSERFGDWKLYVGLLGDDSASVWAGTPRPLDRAVRTSAHNYYLDLVVNFGLLGLAPLLALIGWTAWLAWRSRGRVWRDPGLFSLALAVAFLVGVDALFKVTLRQPYPGIASFFLWGILLARLAPELHTAPMEPRRAP